MAVVTREDYFEVAMELLAESGARSLKITALCRRFGVTVGSFYHHFGSYDAFVADLLGHWQREQTERVIALSTTAADPVQQIRLLKRLVLDLPHDAEAAIRSWAATNDRVHTVQRHVDDERFTALRKVIAGVVLRPAQAKRLAALGMSLLIGIQQWRDPVDRRELAQLLDEYEQTILRHALSAGAA